MRKCYFCGKAENLKKHQVKFWDRAAHGEGFHHPLDTELLTRFVDPASLVVELGCGWGRVLGLLADSGYSRLSGFDPSPAMIERGRKEQPELDLGLWSGGEVPLEDESAGAVLLFAVLTCVPSDNGQRGLIAEAARLLRSDGVLYISDYFLQTDRRNLERYAEYEKAHGTYGVFEIESGEVLRHMDRDWFATLTRDFENVQLREIDVLTMNGNPARAYQYLGRKPE